MAHEQSETIQNARGKWVNVYGRKTKKAGQPLPLLHDFEREEYDTVEEAVDAAKERSRLADDEHDDDETPRRKRGKTILTR